MIGSDKEMNGPNPFPAPDAIMTAAFSFSRQRRLASFFLALACVSATKVLAEDPVKLSLRNNGEIVRIDRRQTLVVDLPVSLGSGNYWTLAAPPPAPLALALAQEDIDEGPEGVVGQQTFAFSAAGAGTGRGELRLSYFEPLRRGFGLAQEFKVTVNAR